MEKLKTNPEYVRTPWADNAPPAINSENLNKIENALMTSRSTENLIITEVLNIDSEYKLADKSLKDQLDSLTLLDLTNSENPEDIVILDAGDAEDDQ